jgi:AraC family transcriptional regulator, regulatory protein of adaptative response / methylphosphotriester-DNA alkyltransferase methyltransferase
MQKVLETSMPLFRPWEVGEQNIMPAGTVNWLNGEISPLMQGKSQPSKLFRQYITELRLHLHDLKDGKADRCFEIEDFAFILCVSPGHLTNTLHQLIGRSTCSLYEEGLLQIAQELLVESNRPISQIARQLHYDPSNFGKFFKSYMGITPGAYRKSQA